MEIRDRLIELMEQGEHKTPCEYDEDCDCTGVKCDACVRVSVADHLLANGVIVLQCRVGDSVYQIDAERVYELEVFDVSLRKYQPYYETESIDFDSRAIGKPYS